MYRLLTTATGISMFSYQLIFPLSLIYHKAKIISPSVNPKVILWSTEHISIPSIGVSSNCREEIFNCATTYWIMIWRLFGFYIWSDFVPIFSSNTGFCPYTATMLKKQISQLSWASHIVHVRQPTYQGINPSVAVLDVGDVKGPRGCVMKEWGRRERWKWDDHFPSISRVTGWVFNTCMLG